MNPQPRYVVYIPTKGRWQPERALTARALLRDRIPFRLVVNRDEEHHYRKIAGPNEILLLPENDGGLIYARNWIKDHSAAQGHARHWQLDDNIRTFRRLWKGRRIPADAGTSLRTCEDLSDRYTNVAISGLAYQMYVMASTAKPFTVNVHVYSCTLVNNAIPNRWRLVYNDDTDMCLQVLADGWCTILVQAYMADKATTMTVRGGNTDALYQGDGRLKMARALERAWPGVVTVDRRYGRPAHVINWKKFTTPLERVEGDISAFSTSDEYGTRLRSTQDVASPALRHILDDREEQTP